MIITSNKWLYTRGVKMKTWEMIKKLTEDAESSLFFNTEENENATAARMRDHKVEFVYVRTNTPCHEIDANWSWYDYRDHDHRNTVDDDKDIVEVEINTYMQLLTDQQKLKNMTSTRNKNIFSKWMR